ncbi:MAG TPA: hypothetical protein VFC90_06540 [Planctomycetota bacterium]|nr:hypothetical protein [Planctomycetota bacterium]
MERSAYPNPAVVTASKNLVNVVAHAGTGARNSWDTNHGTKEIKQGTEKVKVCRLYNSLVCSDHVEIFKERLPVVYGDKTFPTPFHIYYSPAGEELFRSEGAVTAQQLAKEMTDALAKVPGNHISKDEYDGAKKELSGGAALVKKDEIKKAIELFTKMTKHKNEMLRPMGQKELDALEASGHARVQAALQTLENQGGEEPAKKELKKVADEYPPLPCAKEAAEILRLMAEKGR